MSTPLSLDCLYNWSLLEESNWKTSHKCSYHSMQSLEWHISFKVHAHMLRMRVHLELEVSSTHHFLNLENAISDVDSLSFLQWKKKYRWSVFCSKQILTSLEISGVCRPMHRDYESHFCWKLINQCLWYELFSCLRLYIKLLPCLLSCSKYKQRYYTIIQVGLVRS